MRDVISFSHITYLIINKFDLCCSLNKLIKLPLISLILLVLTGQINAQNCNDFHVNNCDGIGIPFKCSGQSRSFNFESGQTTAFHFTVYEDFQYHIYICPTNNLQRIFFRLRNDNSAQDILYDNSVDGDNSLETIFISHKTGNLIIEIVVPVSNENSLKNDYKSQMGCVGVLIEFLSPGKQGLN